MKQTCYSHLPLRLLLTLLALEALEISPKHYQTHPSDRFPLRVNKSICKQFLPISPSLLKTTLSEFQSQGRYRYLPSNCTYQGLELVPIPPTVGLLHPPLFLLSADSLRWRLADNETQQTDQIQLIRVLNHEVWIYSIHRADEPLLK
ncbi:hypothetical protein B0H16DRAFT_1454871 [Mycena metata]|uniref:Uncharacterized protein n=1 Tax=Mycena metata TaxID=1033252 RepID=A0AAD7JH54_9AGAR|nr:hypothetical protein B0H16DRAFT_1454871 [Mycena metata]